MIEMETKLEQELMAKNNQLARDLDKISLNL